MERCGFTLLELLIVVTIFGIVASIGVPEYVSALRTARVGKARHELVTMSNAIQAFAANNAGRLPLTLYQVGFGGKLDPWGVPYCYFNYADGSGDGFDWAIEGGLVEQCSIVSSTGEERRPPGRAQVEGKRAGLSAMASDQQGPAPTDGKADAGSPVARVISRRLVSRLGRPLTPGEQQSLTTSLTGVDAVSMFVEVPVEHARRRDGFMFPLNSDFDLFSRGPDCLTVVPLNEAMAQDDVIRANNGGFFGPASDY